MELLKEAKKNFHPCIKWIEWSRIHFRLLLFMLFVIRIVVLLILRQSFSIFQYLFLLFYPVYVLCLEHKIGHRKYKQDDLSKIKRMICDIIFYFFFMLLVGPERWFILYFIPILDSTFLKDMRHIKQVTILCLIGYALLGFYYIFTADNRLSALCTHSLPFLSIGIFGLICWELSSEFRWSRILRDKIIRQANYLEACEVILKESVKRTKAPIATIMIPDKLTGDLVIAASIGIGEEDKKLRLPKTVNEKRGICRQVYETREAILENDVKHNPYYISFEKVKREVLSELTVPIFDGNETYGVLNLEAYDLKFIEEDKKTQIKLAKELVAIFREEKVFQTLIKFHNLEEKCNTLSEVLKIGQMLNGSLIYLSKIYYKIVEIVPRVLGVEACYLYLIDPADPGYLKLEATNLPISDEKRKIYRHNIEKGICGKIFRTQEPLTINEELNENDLFREEYPEEEKRKEIFGDIRSKKIVNLLGVPLLVEKEKEKITLGVLKVVNKAGFPPQDYGDFSKEDCELMEILASEISIAVWNVKQFATIQQQDLTQFTVATTHGFKQPMQIIKNQVEILRKKGMDQYKEGIEIIDNQVHRMYEIISVFSRFSSPTIERDIDINKILNQTLAKINIPENVKVTKGDDDIPKVNCDPGQIEQVFENLILNGCEAMPNGGGLKIIASRDNSKVKIVFEDEGKGIPDYAKEKVFNPFFTTKKGKGSGLGLYISQFIIQNHRGKISFESRKDGGTRFIVEFPV